MKIGSGLLVSPPSESILARLYHELAKIGAPSVGADTAWPYDPAGTEELLALASEMLRYDPRLLSILVQLTLAEWQNWNPVRLRRELARTRTPQAFLVVLGFVRLATSDPELGYFVDYVSAGGRRVEPSERFFLDASRPGSRTLERQLGRNLAPYSRWGFIGSERPTVDPVTKRTVGRYDARTRRRLLEELLEKHGEIGLAEYLAAVDGAISRQQARDDLRLVPGLVTVGHGRGARWKRLEAPAAQGKQPAAIRAARQRNRSSRGRHTPPATASASTGTSRRSAGELAPSPPSTSKKRPRRGRKKGT